jgi:D-alanine-D-alanine ligase
MKTSRTRVLVIGGGQNCEHDVSLASAAAVVSELDAERYAVEQLTIARDGTWTGGDGAPLLRGLAEVVTRLHDSDVVFPALHGPRGEDGTLAALCDLAGRPVVGSGVRAGALAMDKWATKLVANAVGLKTAYGHLVTSSEVSALGIEPPVVVKPVAAGSSYGVTLAAVHSDITAALERALAFDDRVLVEEVIVGREIDVAVVEWPDGRLVVSPPLEIALDGHAVFDLGTKYDGSVDFRIPADVSSAELVALETAALAMFEHLGCSGLARFDFFLTQEGLVLNEVNTMPGMTEYSQVPRMFAAAGLSYARLLDLLIETALRGRTDAQSRATGTPHR